MKISLADTMSVSDLGTSNPALTDGDNSTLSTIRVYDNHNNTLNTPTMTSRHRNSADHTPTSPDSDYDEGLAFPDSVTIVSMGGGNPILVERKDDEDGDSITPDTDIPFASLYNAPVKFTSFQRNIYIPGMETHVQIVEHERSMTTHFLNPNL